MLRLCLAVVLLMVSGCAGNKFGTSDAFVRCETTAGDFTLELYKRWGPSGYQKFMELVKAGFFDGQLVYRAIQGFVAQFGIAADPEMQKAHDKVITDDTMGLVPFTAGTLSFAGSGPKSRSTHMFIADSPRGERLGKKEHEVPIGRMYDDREREAFFKNLVYKYGDLSHKQRDLLEQGNVALESFPDLTQIKTCYKIKPSVAKKYKAKLDQIDKEAADEVLRQEAEAQRKIEDTKAAIVRIEKILEAKSPKTLKKLPHLLKHWAGKELELLKSLESKHGVGAEEEL